MSTMTATALATAAPATLRAPAAALRGAPEPGVRVTRRGRLVVLAAALLLMLGVLVALSAASTAGSTATAVSYEEVVVQPGETLWEIAQAAAPTTDPRVTVAAVIEINDLSGGAVAAGQRLRLPVVAG